MKGVATMEDWTAGDWTGLVGGAVVALAAIGKGLAWLLNWQGAREDRKAAKLERWEASLIAREKKQQDELQERFADLEKRFAERDALVTSRDKTIADLQLQVSALGASMFDVTTALRAENPTSPALARAAASLRVAFPAEVDAPIGLAELIAQLDRKDDGGGNDG